jgi:hypothetical protein
MLFLRHIHEKRPCYHDMETSKCPRGKRQWNMYRQFREKFRSLCSVIPKWIDSATPNFEFLCVICTNDIKWTHDGTSRRSVLMFYNLWSYPTDFNGICYKQGLKSTNCENILLLNSNCYSIIPTFREIEIILYWFYRNGWYKKTRRAYMTWNTILIKIRALLWTMFRYDLYLTKCKELECLKSNFEICEWVKTCRIWGSHSCEYEEGWLLGCSAV